MAGLKTRPRKTVDDYLRLPDDVRAELIEGEILMSPALNLAHQRFIGKLHLELAAHVRKHALGEVILSPMDVHLPGGDIVQPDLIFVTAGRRFILQDWIRGVPDLLVEVLSPTHAERDRIVKRDLYARSGVREYWIADPEERNIEVLSLSAGRYGPAGFFQAGDALRSPNLPDLDLPVGPLFE